MDQTGSLKWRFDISTFRLIGRDLITDRVTALFELIKNCYDANATEVTISFENVGNGAQESVITISDNGIGMSFEDIRDKWMVIGTSNKRKNTYTPAPMNRRCVGEKGIGRFAVDKLGDKVTISTKQAGNTQWLVVEIDWEKYYSQSKGDGLILFTDIENAYHYVTSQEESEHGTTLTIRSIREKWLENDIKRFISEVSRMVSPFSYISYPINIKVIAPEYQIDKIASKSIDDISLATKDFKLDFNQEENYQEFVVFNESTSAFDIKRAPIKSFGGVKMRVFYFDDSARRKYRKEFPNDQIDGIKIYRDGIITTPFAESEEHNDKKRDVLGIDKRLWMNLFDRVSTREILGVVEISNNVNPKIIDATNRQDFVDNQEYRDLKDFIINQLDAIERYKIYKRKEKRKSNQSSLEQASDELQAFIQSAENLSQDNPSLEPVIKQAKKAGKEVKTAIIQQKEAEQEFERKESIYMSIMSLQEYAIHITHAVRTTLNKIRDRIEYFNLFFPDESKNKIFEHYAKRMGYEFVILNKVIDYMLSYSQSNIKPEDIQLIDTINEVLAEYTNKFEAEGIQFESFLPKSIILKNTNKIFFRDILQNLIDNSIKALRASKQKLFRISVEAANDKLIMKISDSGPGIDEDKAEWVFGLYNTTTAESGGAGVGLYIVKTRVESLKGKVYVGKSEYGEYGTTIYIELPFK